MNYRILIDLIASLKDIETPNDAPLKHSLLIKVADELKIGVNRNSDEYFKAVFDVQDLICTPPEKRWGRIDFVLQRDVDIDRFKIFVLQVLTPYFALIELIQNNELKEMCLNELSNFFITQVKERSYVSLKTKDAYSNFARDAIESFIEFNEFDKNYKNLLFNLVNVIRKDEEKLRERDLEFCKKDEERKNIEKDKNFKETGIKETDVERRIREEIDKNFKETGISETDYQRQLREEESNEKDKNFKETGISETNFERNLREDEEKVIKEETEGDELIQQYGFIAESYYEEYKNGLIDIEKLRKQLTEMKNKGMLKQDYIDYLLETIEEE